MTGTDRGDGDGNSESPQRDDSRLGDELGRRQWLGLVALGGGIVLLVAADAYPPLGSDNRLLLVAVATVTLILGLFEATDRRITTGRVWDPPEPEPGTDVPVPGESFERLSDRELRARIRTRAVVSLCDATDCSRETAERRLADGTWTGDRLAAAFLGDDLEPPRRSRLWARLTGADLTERGRTRAMAAIAAIRAGDRGIERAVPGDARREASGDGERAGGSRT